MNPMALQAIGTGLSIFSSLSSGRQARREAAFKEQQLRIQMEQEKLSTLQRMNDRNEQLLANEKINRAFVFSKLGRDPSDRSFRAFMERNKRTASQDIDRLQTQHVQTMGKLGTEIQTTRMAASNAKTASLLGAATAGISGLFRYYDYKTDKTNFRFTD